MSPAFASLFLLPRRVHTKETEGNLAWPWFFSGVVSLLAWLSSLLLFHLQCTFRPLTFGFLPSPCWDCSFSLKICLLQLWRLCSLMDLLLSVLPPSPSRALLSQPVRCSSEFHFFISPSTFLLNLIRVLGYVCPLTLSLLRWNLLFRLSTQTCCLLVISTWMFRGSKRTLFSFSPPESFLLHVPPSWGMTSLPLYLPKPET